MALVRMLCSWGPASAPVVDRKSNTLYFNVSGSLDDPGYQNLANDLLTIYMGRGDTAGAQVQIRAYDMADAKPRPERAFAQGTAPGNLFTGVQQSALCLSYYADRNLPRTRGRIYTGFGINASTNYASAATMTSVINFGKALAGLGGLNVDWSVYSPTTNQHTRISNIWVDDSWDIIRSRKLKATTRQTATING